MVSTIDNSYLSAASCHCDKLLIILLVSRQTSMISYIKVIRLNEVTFKNSKLYLKRNIQTTPNAYFFQ